MRIWLTIKSVNYENPLWYIEQLGVWEPPKICESFIFFKYLRNKVKRKQIKIDKKFPKTNFVSIANIACLFFL